MRLTKAARLAGRHLRCDPILQQLYTGFITAIHYEHTLDCLDTHTQRQISRQPFISDPIFQSTISCSDF